MNSKKTPINIHSNKHRGSLAIGYLKLAEQGFLYLQKQPNIGRRKHPNPAIPPIYRLEDGNLIIAAIWNIKHAIELIIKSLGIELDKKYKQEHDLKTLLDDLETRLDGLYIEKHFKILEKIVTKYYNCDFSPKTFSLDKENTFFKYPETIDISLDYSFVHNLKRKDINQFLRDIQELEGIYNRLEHQREDFKNDRKYGINKKKTEKRLLNISTMTI